MAVGSQKPSFLLMKFLMLRSRQTDSGNRMTKTDQSISIFKGIADTLTDEVVELKNGRKQFIHHVNSNPNHKLVIGSSSRGKSVFSNMTTVEFNPNGFKTHPNIAMVEGLLGGVGRLVFPDGTVQFAENETYPEVVYSPRMKVDELEVFCKSNLSKYEAYFDTNFAAIDKGDELPPISVFW